jgi:hypothetical protein
MEPAERSTPPRLMFVLSAAFGELFTAMYMVTGCRFHTAFAMRDPWYSLNRAGLPGAIYRFEHLNGLLAAIEEEAPDLVCLFCGYLFVKDEIFNYDDLDRLVKYLRVRGIKVVTSDPFLGLISRLPVLDFQNPIEQLVTLPFRLGGEALFGPMFPYFLRVRAILNDVPHVYVVEPEEQGVRALAFYNPNIRRSGSDHLPARHDKHHGTPAHGHTQPYWLFIIAEADYRPQVRRDGAEWFHAGVARRLRETMEQGRRATLIAPAPCIDALEPDELLKECSFVRYCDFHTYLAILLGAEYAFYWNIFSASLVARLLNRLPTFFFAPGHIADENRQMFEKGLACYYRNGQPTYLSVADPLDADWLSTSAAIQEQQLFVPFFNNVWYLPTPEAMVRTLLNER